MSSTTHNTQLYLYSMQPHGSTRENSSMDVDISMPPPKPPRAYAVASSISNETSKLDCMASPSKNVIKENQMTSSEAFAEAVFSGTQKSIYSGGQEEKKSDTVTHENSAELQLQPKLHATQRSLSSELREKALKMSKRSSAGSEEELLEKSLSILNLDGGDQATMFKSQKQKPSECWADEIRGKGLKMPADNWFTTETTRPEGIHSKLRDFHLQRMSLNPAERTKSKSFEQLLETKKRQFCLSLENEKTVLDNQSAPHNISNSTNFQTPVYEQTTPHMKLTKEKSQSTRKNGNNEMEENFRVGLNLASEEKALKSKEDKIEDNSKTPKRYLEKCDTTAQDEADSILKKFRLLRTPRAAWDSAARKKPANFQIPSKNSVSLNETINNPQPSQLNSEAKKSKLVLQRRAERESRSNEIEENASKIFKRSLDLLKTPVKKDVQKILNKFRLHRIKRSLMTSSERKRVKEALAQSDTQNSVEAYEAIEISSNAVQRSWEVESTQFIHKVSSEEQDFKLQKPAETDKISCKKATFEAEAREDNNLMLQYMGLQPTPRNSLDSEQPENSQRNENINMRIVCNNLKLSMDTSPTSFDFSSEDQQSEFQPQSHVKSESEIEAFKKPKRKSKTFETIEQDDSVLKKYLPRSIEERQIKSKQVPADTKNVSNIGKKQEKINESLWSYQYRPQSIKERIYFFNKLESNCSKPSSSLAFINTLKKPETIQQATIQHVSPIQMTPCDLLWKPKRCSKQMEINSEQDSTTTNLIETPSKRGKSSHSSFSSLASSSTSSLTSSHAAQRKCSLQRSDLVEIS